jgi:quercetin dioxygenase-like cupin family protein
MVKIVTQNFDHSVAESNPPMFIGEVRRQQIVADEDAPALRASAISFLDGARNRWHHHSTEQVLVVTHGVGIIADASGERRIQAGDVVLVQPNERHWHGAAPGEDLTHLSILLPGALTIEEDQS